MHVPGFRRPPRQHVDQRAAAPRVVDDHARPLRDADADWARSAAVRAFMTLLVETGGTACMRLSYDKSGARTPYAPTPLQRTVCPAA
ncbi:hypothetical protein WI41_19780 [Burkholderia latens]|uniref:Uncharacterized protein n=1 Tax=Burkholderia latens TaxID=488446 RepID=A0AAP1C8Q7_9BURK|nr:hypothetical protein WI41_19780 [Burkholderia latens]